jgi:hypothetical protein
MVEIAPDIRQRPQKLWRLILDVTFTEHSFEGVNYSSSSRMRLPFSNSLKIDFEKSLAIGKPFWNACMEVK